MMIFQYTAAALASENKVLAHPASVDSIPTSANQEDHVSMGSIAARHARTVLEHVERIVAIELLVGAQALDLRLARRDGRGRRRRPTPGAGVAEAHRADPRPVAPPRRATASRARPRRRDRPRPRRRAGRPRRGRAAADDGRAAGRVGCVADSRHATRAAQRRVDLVAVRPALAPIREPLRGSRDRRARSRRSTSRLAAEVEHAARRRPGAGPAPPSRRARVASATSRRAGRAVRRRRGPFGASRRRALARRRPSGSRRRPR